MPVYDNDVYLTNIVPDTGPPSGEWRELMIPCEDRHSVGYNVYGWDYKKQVWHIIDTGGYYDEAKEIADEYDKKMVKELGIYCDDMGDKKSYDDI
jgi:hypothetical protein